MWVAGVLIEDDHPCRNQPTAQEGYLSKVVHQVAHLPSQAGYGGSLIAKELGLNLYPRQVLVTPPPLPRARLDLRPDHHSPVLQIPDEIFIIVFSHFPTLRLEQLYYRVYHQHALTSGPESDPQCGRDEGSRAAYLHSAVPFHETKVPSVTVGTFAIFARLSAQTGLGCERQVSETVHDTGREAIVGCTSQVCASVSCRLS